MTAWKDAHFPFDVFARGGPEMPGRDGDLVRQVQPMSMFPPYPWGQWLYGRVFRERCAGLDGDILEAGVGSGGMSLFLALVVKELGQERQVLSLDSFEGLPAPDDRKDNPCFVQGEYGPSPDSQNPLTALLGGSHNALLETFRLSAHGLGVDHIVRPVQGFFDDVLPGLDPNRRYSFVHIDADLHSSVLCVLEHVWDSVVEGGVVAIDDFFHPVQGPVRATAEFFNSRGLTPLYHVAFPYSVFVIKEDWGRVSRSVDGNAYSLGWLRSDEFFLQSLEASRKRARRDRRARENCSRLLEALRAEPYSGEIYDYWRSLEAFWAGIDIRPEDKLAAGGSVKLG
jgi:macrocin-O-methyltransferase TylF-like protien